MTPLAEMLYLWRAHRRLTMRAAAKLIGISHATLCRIEQGKPCDLVTWLRMQTWLLEAR